MASDPPLGVLRLYYPGGGTLPSSSWRKGTPSTQPSRWTKSAPQLRLFFSAEYTSTTLREFMGAEYDIHIPKNTNILDYFDAHTQYRASLVQAMLAQGMVPPGVDLKTMLRELGNDTNAADRSLFIISTRANDSFNLAFSEKENVTVIAAHGLSVPQMQDKRYEHVEAFSFPGALVIYIGYALSSELLSSADEKNRIDVAVPRELQARTSHNGPPARIVRKVELDHMLDAAIDVIFSGTPLTAWHAPTWMCVQADDEEAAKRYRMSGCDSHSFAAVSGAEPRWLAY